MSSDSINCTLGQISCSLQAMAFSTGAHMQWLRRQSSQCSRATSRRFCKSPSEFELMAHTASSQEL